MRSCRLPVSFRIACGSACRIAVLSAGAVVGETGTRGFLAAELEVFGVFALAIAIQPSLDELGNDCDPPSINSSAVDNGVAGKNFARLRNSVAGCRRTDESFRG